MIEERKQKEIEYYDKKARRFSGQGDFEGFDPFVLKSYQFLRSFLKDKIQGRKVLDYGSGNGLHSVWLAQLGGEVTGIDLSQNSLEIARKNPGLRGVNFLTMDCENLKFPDNHFDIVFDGGTFSSLDVNQAYAQIYRVLKPDGFLIGIETLGHNPLANFKRMVNKITGKRTQWAASHILKSSDLEEAKKYFKDQEVYYFHFISCLIFPFLKMPGFLTLLKIFEKIDKTLLRLPFFKKFAFKTVFIFKK